MEFEGYLGAIAKISKRVGINNIIDEISEEVIELVWVHVQNAALELNLSGQKRGRRQVRETWRRTTERLEVDKTGNEIRWLSHDIF